MTHVEEKEIKNWQQQNNNLNNRRSDDNYSLFCYYHWDSSRRWTSCLRSLFVWLTVCCGVLRRWDWGKRWSLSLAEEHEASPVRRTTSTRTLRANCAFLLHRWLSGHTHTLRIWKCCRSITWIYSLLLLPVPCRRGKASLNTGWTIYEPNLEKCFIISTSWRASQSVSCSLYLVIVVIHTQGLEIYQSATALNPLREYIIVMENSTSLTCKWI